MSQKISLIKFAENNSFFPIQKPLLVWLYSSHEQNNVYFNACLTHSFMPEESASAWDVIDQEFTFSGGTFSLLQKVLVKQNGKIESFINEPLIDPKANSGLVKYYVTGEPERPDNKFLLFRFSDNFSEIILDENKSVPEFSSMEEIIVEMERTVEKNVLGVRVLETFFWHIHM